MNGELRPKHAPRELFWILVASCLLLVGGALLALKYANPAPPRRVVIATGNQEGGYQWFAQHYQRILKRDGIDLQLRETAGARENLQLLKDPHSKVDVAFAQDGLESNGEGSGLISLGSLYYEPLWVFYRGPVELTRFSQLRGKRIALGERGGGAAALAWRLLKASGVEKTDARFLHVDYPHAMEALRRGEADVAFFIAKPGAPFIRELLAYPGVRLMSIDQAEAICRRFPYLHHLVLPHGAVDLQHNLPERDVQMISPTATLIAREGFHPALIDLLLKAATEVHGRPGIFESKGEFPIDKDSVFTVSDEAKRFYKSGTPFWQRFFPFWLASLLDRFLLVILPLLAVIVPMVKLIPRFLEWRAKGRIYQCYGELKYLETKMRNETDHLRYAAHLQQLDAVEERVNHLKIPLGFSDHLYVLREHIAFVRARLQAP